MSDTTGEMDGQATLGNCIISRQPHEEEKKGRMVLEGKIRDLMGGEIRALPLWDGMLSCLRRTSRRRPHLPALPLPLSKNLLQSRDKTMAHLQQRISQDALGLRRLLRRLRRTQHPRLQPFSSDRQARFHLQQVRLPHLTVMPFFPSVHHGISQAEIEWHPSIAASSGCDILR